MELWEKIENVRAPLFANKKREWISVNVFDKFPEIHMENNPSGWVLGAFGRGKVTKVFTPAAKEWLSNHYHEIDWERS